MYKLEELNNKKVADLKKIGEELSIPKFEKLKKQELIYAILDHQAENSKMKPENSKMKKKIKKHDTSNKEDVSKNNSQKNIKQNKIITISMSQNMIMISMELLKLREL